jgi:hypothetical protein
MRKAPLAFIVLALVGCTGANPSPTSPRYLADAAAAPTTAPAAESNFTVKLPPHRFADALRPDSPFGINTALRPDAPDLEPRLRAMQDAGMKWGRQDFNWPRIETEPGKYDWAPYDRLVDRCRAHGILLLADLTGAPAFHDPRTPAGVKADADFARAAVEHFRGRVEYWQIWNEPNGG